MGVLRPKRATLDRYGLTMRRWEEYVEAQGGVCPICERLPSSGRLCVDHEHCRGWARMPDEERAMYTRGLCCFHCNRFFLARGMSPQRALNVKNYLDAYLARRPTGRLATG